MSEETTTAGAPSPPSGTPGTPVPTLGATLRMVAVAAAIGAAVVHAALAPSHYDEAASHGVFFLTVAWLQLAVAGALAHGRDRPEPWLAALAVNGGVALVWLGSRTIGVPESHHSGIGFPDVLATGLEAAIVVAALVALRPALAARPVPRAHPVVAGVAAVALIGGVSASVTPSMSGHEEGGHSHAAAADGAAHAAPAQDAAHSHGTGDAAGAAAEDRCDLGFNTVGYNGVAQPGQVHVHDAGEPVPFTLDQWANVFVDPADGLAPETVANFIESRPALRDGIMSGGLTHTLTPDPWNPMTDPDQCEALAEELTLAQGVAAAHPTVADAEAAGYRKVTPYFPGIAAHYINEDLIDEEFAPDEPEMLLYDGDSPEANMVGLSYYIIEEGDEQPTVGFTGDNDNYHRHVGLCFVDGVVAGGSNTSEADCEERGGITGDGSTGWMSHLWIVPGCESAWGLFSGANPTLTVKGLGPAGGGPTGCGTGRTFEQAPIFDPAGEGPHIAGIEV